mmetsp:Transcript_10326/g.21237  ORF Transcript_10326/g.21237 Transcript_10326/m.21237 type:complete len:233 (-) Transcript_10326:35-733(-)
MSRVVPLVPKPSLYTHYVFGFGSLICSSSRKLTGQCGPVIPVVVADLERSWTAHVDFPGPSPKISSVLGATAVSVCEKSGSTCCGVLLKILDEDELERLDKREGGYERVPIPLSNISPLPSSTTPLPPELLGEQNRFWCYTGFTQVPATPSHPILQSYVDVIIKGCLEFSPEFAKNFISTTSGWDGYWLNDRQSLIYARAEQEWTKSNSTLVDDLLQSSLPESSNLSKRVDE